MINKKVLSLLAALFLLVGIGEASGQAFFLSKATGLAQVRFTSNAAGVQVAIDGQQAGTIPLTVWVVLGVHKFSFTAPGEETKTINYPVKADTEVPYLVTQKLFALTVNTNVPGATLAVDGQAFAGSSTSVSAGAHTLTVNASGYLPISLPFTQPSSQNTINVTLVASTFPLTVNTNVPGATLAVDGQAFAGKSTSVSAGAHTLTVNAPGYQPMSLPFTQPSSQNIINVTLIASTFPLTVNTNVPGATLAVDGQAFAGKSTSVSAGAHTLTVNAPGYQPMSLPFTQPSSQNVINVTLVASTYPLTVNTNVPGATLAVDGQAFAGKSTSVSAGAHTLTVNAPGYQPMSLPFTQPSSQNVINVTLIASTYPLTVNTNVPGATLAVDGQAFAGKSTSVTAGAHTLTVNAPGYQPMSLPFTQPSSQNIINVTLIASTFPLTVNTNVPGATLAVDGNVITGNTIDIVAGSHVLTVSAPNYQALSLPFQQPSQANILNVTLIGIPASVTLNTEKLFKPRTAYKIYINNEESKGPVLNLPAGTYVIRLVSGNTSIETTVTVVSGQNLTLAPSIQW